MSTLEFNFMLANYDDTDLLLSMEPEGLQYTIGPKKSIRIWVKELDRELVTISRHSGYVAVWAAEYNIENVEDEDDL